MLRSRLIPVLAVCLLLVLMSGATPRGKSGAVHRAGRHGSVALPPAPRETASPRPAGGALDEVVLFEDFEWVAPGALPGGWQQVDGDGGHCSWFDGPSRWQCFSRIGFDAYSGRRIVACFFNDGALPNDDWLILPQQNLSGAITLSYQAASQDAEFPERFEVRVSTGGATPADFTQVVFAESAVPAEWTAYEHDLSAFAGAPFRVAFHYNAEDRFLLKLDDVRFEGTPPPSGAIIGTVRDPDAQPIGGVTAAIASLSRQERTDTAGVFGFALVPAGTYNILFSHPHFQTQLLPGQTVAAGETTYVDLTMEPRNLRHYYYSSSNSPRPIYDLDSAFMTIFVPDTFIIYDLDVTVSLNHPYVGDLALWLQTSDTQYVRLVEADPDRDGQNLLDCRLNDHAEYPFTAGHAPFTGTWRPVTPLAQVVGESTIVDRGHNRGNRWHLWVADEALQDEGSLYAFSLHMVEDPAAAALPDRPVNPPAALDFVGAYPNPFNQATRLRFTVDHSMPIELAVYDPLGRQVAILTRGRMLPGTHELVWDAAGLPSGIYFVRLSAAGQSVSRKLLLLR